MQEPSKPADRDKPRAASRCKSRSQLAPLDGTSTREVAAAESHEPEEQDEYALMFEWAEFIPTP
jgi:hypothetical protein